MNESTKLRYFLSHTVQQIYGFNFETLWQLLFARGRYIATM